MIVGIIAMGIFATGCTPVPAGNVGVKIDKYGDERGVNVTVLGPGRYWIGPNTDLFLFPTFTQSFVWSSGRSDESFAFQTVEGLSVKTDIGISYYIKSENAPAVFQKYRRGVDEITQVYLRAMIRDSLNLAASSVMVEDAYGAGKAELQKKVEEDVRKRAEAVGITIESVYFVGEMRLPEAVYKTINNKIAATQIAQQKENELRAANADAAKAIALAKGEAESARIRGS
jgi:regulator of protease activity HflC (stomatin/prohibitin superfamily)